MVEPHLRLMELKKMVPNPLLILSTIDEILFESDPDVLTISLRTVAAHKYRVMELLAITTNAELYHYAVKHRIVSV